MEIVKKALGLQRDSFNRIHEAIRTMMEDSTVNCIKVQGNIRLLDQKFESISELDRQMFDFLLTTDKDDEVLNLEISLADEYATKYYETKLMVEKYSQKNTSDEVDSIRSQSSSNSKRKLKLPTIELAKFGGDTKDWLTFWSQFKRIHDDEDIENEDKFQYLIQSTIPKSRARQLVDSYPPSGDNNPKVIESIRSRFGRDDFLVEFYVRELLKLVLNNLTSKNKLSLLYDKVECQLRALETLNVTSETCAAMLYPLVESCLPEDLIRVWQRSNYYDDNSSLKIRLDNLMKFLKKEVENEERITLAVSGFDMQMQNEVQKKFEPHNKIVPSTASALLNNKISRRCQFCDDSHSTEDCPAARGWDLIEKKKRLMEKGCCHICLRYGHIAKRCRIYTKCSVCSGRHSAIMCPKSNETQGNIVQCGKREVNVESSLSNNTYAEVFLQTLVVHLNGDNVSRKIRVIIDTGSQRSYITQSAATEMNYIPVKQEKMIHSLFGGTKTDVVNHTCYRIRLSNINDSYACNFEALDHLVICNDIASVRQGPWMIELHELGIEATDIEDGPVDVLIGADIVGKLLTGKRHELKCGLVALQTLLGWTVVGKVTSSRQNENNDSSMLAVTSSMLSKDLTISELWKLDILGITDPSEQMSKKESEKAIINHSKETVRTLEDGRYEVNMPWIEGHPPLPSNYTLARKRLDKLTKKLTADGYYDEYAKVFTEWLEEGIIEEVPKEDFKNEGHYLPHRHVVKENSTTTKVRPVFDASANEKGQPSLNHCLEKDINLLELIPSILLKFRLSRIGVIADIRKAFFQISLCPTDRDFLRFLFIDSEGELKTYRHRRVVFGVSCSPFLLGVVIKSHLEKELDKVVHGSSHISESTINKLIESFYVDNCVTSVDTKEELQVFIEESSLVFAQAKFDLRLWEYTVIDNLPISADISPVLGLHWNRNFDTLKLNSDWFREIDTDLVTRRTILSAAHRLFDPIGFASPVSLCPKLLLQKTWESKIGWDTEVSEEIKRDFLIWVKEIPILLNLNIPRWLVTEDSQRWSLHVFCDASQYAYATAIYLRSESRQRVHVQLVQSKSRISPVKKMTIPRLELLAATIGARLSKTVMETMNSDILVYWWSDSTTVLSWIKRSEQWKPFVWNRIEEIRKLTNMDCWFHVPGEINPADLPSRGCSPRGLIAAKWWKGPAWLKQPSDTWPDQNYVSEEDLVDSEKRKDITSSILCVNKNYSWYHERISGYNKIVRVVGWILRFISNCRTQNRRKGELTLKESDLAEKYIMKLIQHEVFDGIEDKNLRSLCHFIDEDGIIRMRTKVSDREDTPGFRYPIVLTSKHPVVTKLVEEQHKKACHLGVQGLLSIMRERFWIIRGRKTLKTIISRCTVCRRYNARSIAVTPVPLPDDRVRNAYIFEIIGVDLAGPLYVRTGEKVWICLYTCAVYRAVHLELVSSLSTDIFLQSLRRFVSRRGRPSIIYSDNGTNLVGARNAFAKLDWTEIQKFSSVSRIEWKLNPPTAAWWGGWWERLIRIVKDLLRKVLGRASLTYEELSTVLCDCESIINSRPLTYLSEDSRDLIPLTPAMFLHEVRETGVPDIDATEASDMRKHLKYRMKLKEDLRRRFRIEYLGQLRLFSRTKTTVDLKVNDVVLVGTDNVKRLDWPLAYIEELIPGRDGEIRLVRLQTASGSLLRPVQKIYPLELNNEENDVMRKRNNQQQNQERSGPEPDIEDKSVPVVVTRYGREVRPPLRFLSSSE